MKIVYILCLSTMLPMWTFSACGTGTLQCQTDDVPSICDFTEGYVLSGSNCEIKKVEGCEIASFDSSNAPCFLCEKGKVLDENSTVCVNVDSEKAKPNCFRYDKSTSDCIECDTDFFLSSGNCVAVGNIKVDNCSVYSSITQCKACDSGYYLSGNDCVKIEAVPNCRLHSNRKCTECDGEYFLNLAFDSNPLLANSSTFELFATGDYSQVSINLESNTTTVCQKITVKHCSKYESASKCAECDEGFFVTAEKTCQRYPETPIPDCVKYASATECVKCQDTHYLIEDSAGQAEQCKIIVDVKDCKEYNKLNGFCSACNDGFWLNEPQNSCVARKYNPPVGCETINPKADKCSKCITGYSNVDDWTGCFIDIAHCKTQVNAMNIEAEKHVCSLCEPEYYPEGGLCKKRTIDNCKEYMPHKNACETCEFTHYNNDTKDTCTEKKVDFCVTYSTNDDTNTCTKCENLKYPKTAEECADIDNKTDCFKSDGVNNNCIECLPNVLRSAAGVCTGAKTETQYDSNCAGNSSQNDDSSCASCKDGYVLLNVDSTALNAAKTQAEMDTMNCLQVGPDGSNCVQCKDGFDLRNGNPGTCVEDQAASSLCLRMRANESGSLETPGIGCEECRADKAAYLNNQICTVANEMGYYINCKQTSKNLGLCEICEDGNYRVDIIKHSPVCAKETITSTKFPNIPDCAVRREFTNCAICNRGKVLNASKDGCEDPQVGKYLFQNAFDYHMHQKGDIAVDPISDCAEYIQVGEDTVLCSKCSTGFVGIISETHFSSKLVDLPSGNELYNVFSECVNKDHRYQKSDKTFHVTDTDCLIGHRPATESTGYGCLRCIPGKIGSVIEVTKDHLEADFANGNKYKYIGSCQTVTELQSSFIGINQVGQNRGDRIISSNYMGYSDCTDSNKVVFYMVKWTLYTGVTLALSANGATANKLAFCGTEAAVISDQKDKIENCTIYTFSTDVPASFNQASDKITAPNCRACKPGFYGIVADGNKGISTCEAIHGCNTPNVATGNHNTWLSACSNPDSGGWKGKKLGESYVVSYHDPMPNSAPYKIDNCLVLSQSEEICVVCKPGFSSTGPKCESITAENSNCTTPSMGLTQNTFDTNSNSDTQKSMIYALYGVVRIFHSEADQFKNYTNSLCNECATDYFLLTSSQISSTVCGKRVAPKKSLDHCIKHSDYGCIECEQNYAYNSTSNKCEEFPSDTNCITFSSGTCNLCKPGFSKYNNKCTEDFCDQRYSNTCLRCQPGKSVVDNTAGICGDNPNSNDPCEVYSPFADGYCVKCKDAGKIPYNYKYEGTGPNFFHVSCETFTAPANGWKDMNSEYLYVTVNKLSNETKSYKLNELEHTSRSKRKYTSTTVGSPATQVCVPSRTISDCEDEKTDYNVVCTTCKQGKSFLTNNTCSDPPVQNCLNPNSDNSYLCSKCTTDYYLAEDFKSCKSRTNKNCESFRDSADECITCHAKQQVRTSAGACVDYTAENCQELHSSEDKCETCVTNAWMDKNDSDKCKLTEDPQCEIMKEKENECKICLTKFYLKTEGLIQKCSPITAEHCETNETHEDKCKTCISGYYYDTDKLCKKNTEIDRCTTYSKTSDRCEDCEEGYYAYSGAPECRKNPSGISNCATYTDEVTCKTCDSNHYLSENKCLDVTQTVSQCLVYDSEKTCSVCIDGNFLLSNTKCDFYRDVVKDKCKEYESSDKCISCLDNYIFNSESKLCEASGIDNCKTAERGSPNLCIECDSGYFLTSNRQACQSPSSPISNCEDYVSQTKCKKCKANHILSLDGSKCSEIGDKAGTNCSRALTTDKLECDICEFGFTKNEIGECVKISEPNCAFMSGDKCGLCLPKMKMDSDGKCSNPNPPPETPVSVDVIKIFTHLLVLLIMIK